MPDVQILSAGIADAPESYTVPAFQEIIVKTVSVSIDGTSASGDFVPVLEIDNGSAAGPWRFTLGQTITAGGSVDVTWFPGLIPPAAASSSLVGIPWAIQAGSGTPITVAGRGGHGEFNTVQASFFTNKAATFVSALNTDFNKYGIQILELGHYLIMVSCEVTSFGAGAIQLQLGLAEGPGFTSFTGDYSIGDIVSSTPIYGVDTSHVYLNSIFVGDATTGNGGLPPPIVVEFDNYGANSATAVMNGYQVIQLDNVDHSIA